VLQISASFVRPEDQARGLEGGADAYLVQPVERQVLVATVNALMRARRAEEALRQSQAQLTEALGAAESANAAKDQFLAALSHELRTPLTPILAAVQLLETAEGPLSPAVRETLNTVRRNVLLEARLIDDLLDITRISKGKVHLHTESVDAHELVRSVIEICRSESQEKRQDVRAELTSTRRYVLGDAARLHQVLWNLLRNAVKFTPVGGRITVRSEDAGRRLRIAVTDTGIGIEPDALAKIFKPFEQGGNEITRQFGGLGLGLAISKTLVDLHGGTLWARSEGAGKGATFVVELNLAPQSANGPDPTPDAGAAGPRARRLNILLVEDHDDTRSAMVKLIQAFGHDVRGERNVADAVVAARGEDFDLLISDIGLPDGTGLDLMRSLLEADRPVKGIVLSGYGMEDDVRRSRDAGFIDHLTKPINVQQLRAAIERIAGDVS
jgi:signal transduction histidine kinase